MAIPNEVIQEINDKVNIVDVVSGYVRLKRSGSSLMGLCPFHSEKTPSFSVSEQKQFYHCFGCGAGGTAINFIMQMENLSFVDAVRLLGDRYGIRVPEDTNYDDRKEKLRKRLYEINREAGRFFFKCLCSDTGKNARAYFAGRKLTEETIKKFGLGFAPDSWDSLLKHLKSKGFSDYEMVSAGLVTQNESKKLYDRYRNRVMFPIFDVRGNLIAFGGRVLDDSKPKYLNTNDTLIFDKSANLFALNLAKKNKSKQIIVVEGYMDVITLHQYGVDTAVASLGTALTQNHARLLQRYADEVVLCYDSDEAGVKAANRATEILSAHDIKTRILTLSGAKDPDEFCKKYGAEEFLRVASGAKSPVLYKMDGLKAKYDLNVPEEKIEFLKETAKELVKLPTELERELFAKSIAEKYGVSFEAINSQIKTELTKYKNNKVRKERIEIYNDLKQKSVIAGNSDRFTEEAVKKLLNLMFYDYDVYIALRNNITFDLPDDFYTEFLQKIDVFRQDSKADPKESEFIAEFPFEQAGKITAVLSMPLNYENNTAAAQQLINSINKVLEKKKIGADPQKAREYFQKHNKEEN